MITRRNVQDTTELLNELAPNSTIVCDCCKDTSDLLALLPTLGPLVALIIFLIGLHSTNKRNKKNAERHFLLDIVLNNFSTVIAELFDFIADTIKNTQETVVTQEKMPVDKMQNLCLDASDMISSKINAFQRNFIAIVRASHELKADLLVFVLLQLEDIPAETFDTINFKEIDIEVVEEQINKKLTLFYKILYVESKELEVIKRAFNLIKLRDIP